MLCEDSKNTIMSFLVIKIFTFQLTARAEVVNEGGED